MMSTKTISDSFFSLLPNFNVDGSAVYRKVYTTSISTMDEEPLKALKWEHFDSILEVGRNYLSNTIFEDNNILCQPANIPLQSTTIKTKADVTAQAILHLLYQVNHTINQHLQNGQIKTNLKSVQKGAIVRTDYRWTFHPHDGNPVPFAVLEMKAPNLISREDFKDATALYAGEEKAKLRQANFQETGTLLRDNGQLFIQQVKKYLQTMNINDAALFDWNHLVILDIDGLDEDKKNPTLARFTWFD